VAWKNLRKSILQDFLETSEAQEREVRAEQKLRSHRLSVQKKAMQRLRGDRGFRLQEAEKVRTRMQNLRAEQQKWARALDEADPETLRTCLQLLRAGLIKSGRGVYVVCTGAKPCGR
jgi:hypothetical protein